MNGPLTAAAAAVTALSVLAGVGLHDMAQSLAPQPITIDALSYDPATGRALYLPRAVGHSPDHPLVATWRADLKRREPDGSAAPVCAGRGTGDYWERAQPLRRSLAWLISEACPGHLAPGSYRIWVEIVPTEGRAASRVFAFSVED